MVKHNKSNKIWKSDRKKISQIVTKPFDIETREKSKEAQRTQHNIVKKLQKELNGLIEETRQKEIRKIKQRREAKQQQLWKEQKFERLKQSTQKSTGKNKRVKSEDHKRAKIRNEVGNVIVR